MGGYDELAVIDLKTWKVWGRWNTCWSSHPHMRGMQTRHPATVIGYIRVSTDDQRVNGVSLDAQRTRLKAYCAAHGLELLRIEEDAGISGRSIKKRPALRCALSALHDNDRERPQGA